MSSNKHKVNNRVGFINRPTYKEFIKKHPESKITYNQFIEVLKESTKAIRDYVVAGELGFKLPYELGYIAVHKYKPNGNKVFIDWNTSRKLGKLIPYTNLHSFGYMYKVMLFKNSRVKPLQGYNMDAHRILKRMVGAKVKSEKHNYIQIDSGCFTKRFSIDNYLKKRR